MTTVPEHGGETPVEPRVSGLAAWSFVCGLFFFLLPMGIAAIVLSTIARRAIRRSQGRLVGERIALMGRWMGVASIAFACYTIMVLPALTLAREATKAVTCRSNLKQIGMAIGMYESDHRSGDGYYMPPDLRTLVGMEYLQYPGSVTVLRCPDAEAWRKAPHNKQLQDADRDSDYVYARLTDAARAPEDVPIMWDRYRHMRWKLWPWIRAPEPGVNAMLSNLSVRWVSDEAFTAALARYRPLYESEPRLPVVGGAPSGWGPVQYTAAAVVTLYAALVVVAVTRRRWLYALLPDRPRDVEAQRARAEEETADAGNA